MSKYLLRAGLPGLAIALVPLSESAAHEIVGNRFFPATLGIDDPGVNDELSLPTVANRRSIGQAARYIGGVFPTDHRGFRGVVWIDLQQPEATRRIGRDGPKRIPESRYHLQVPRLQGPRA